jgi:hypothetical protein
MRQNSSRSSGADYPVSKVTYESDVLLAFLDESAEHRVTCGPALESTFSVVRLWKRVTKGAGSRAVGLAMPHKLMQAAQKQVQISLQRKHNRMHPRVIKPMRMATVRR